MNIRVGGTELDAHRTAVFGEDIIGDIEPVMGFCGRFLVIKSEDHKLSLCRVIFTDANDGVLSGG